MAAKAAKAVKAAAAVLVGLAVLGSPMPASALRLGVVPSLAETAALSQTDPLQVSRTGDPGTATAVNPAAADARAGEGKLIKLANTGLNNGGVVEGRVQGPFSSVRATTIPWNLRPMLGAQINGAPEPLVYSPVYRFTPSEGSAAQRPKNPMDMFKTPYNFQKAFLTPGAKYTVQGDTSPGANPLSMGSSPGVASAFFANHAPQPPPYTAPTPPDPGQHPVLRTPATSPPPDRVPE